MSVATEKITEIQDQVRDLVARIQEPVVHGFQTVATKVEDRLNELPVPDLGEKLPTAEQLTDARDKVGETYAVVHRTRHRWFYFPRLTPDEVVLLKIYDSQATGTARLSAHTAFEDPTTPEGAPPRQSIEARTIAFFS